MLIMKKCPFCLETRLLELDVTPQQLVEWHNGKLIQNAMPHLTTSEREFIKTGICDSCWNTLFGEE